MLVHIINYHDITVVTIAIVIGITYRDNRLIVTIAQLYMYHNVAVEFNHARCTALIMLNVARHDSYCTCIAIATIIPCSIISYVPEEVGNV